MTTPLTPAQKQDFVRYVRNPHIWRQVAARQFAVAKYLHAKCAVPSAAVALTEELRTGMHYASQLQAGFAVENASKAVLVARSPEIIDDAGRFDLARLKRARGGHALTSLVKEALGSLTDREEWVLRRLEESVVWAAKYPAPLDGSILFNPEIMDRMREAPPDALGVVEDLLGKLLVRI